MIANATERDGVPCKKTRAIREFMRDRSRVLFSSRGLGWSGLLMEQHEFSADEWPAAELSGLLLCLWNSPQTKRCDHPDTNGKFVPKLVHPGTLSLYTPGALPSVRTCGPGSGLLCAFDTKFLLALPEGIRTESNMRSVADGVISQDKRCFRDAPAQHILEQLSDEARRGGHAGAIYANQLIRTLCARLLELAHAGRRVWLKNKIDTCTAHRLSDRLEAATETGLDLDTLAAESGCSQRQLLRSFRAGSGRSPHQYILDLRIEKARRLMLTPRLSLMDIALECGFASQAHFTYAFRQRQGLPPSDFRRRL